ncbi:MAG: YXWGXW repeat-containing protein [Betaproteobacteria bacterium]|nr:YXWGXW repeat-containing protein [Betaproteobacteria bacterium]
MVKTKYARKFLSALLIATGTLGAAAIPQVSVAAVGIHVQVAPPAPRFERVPVPRRGYLWVPGYWDWRGHRHVWVGGTWVKERRGYYYQPHRWVERNGGWYLDRGRWDRDRDGIPDRVDRHPNNPYRP